VTATNLVRSRYRRYNYIFQNRVGLTKFEVREGDESDQLVLDILYAYQFAEPPLNVITRALFDKVHALPWPTTRLVEASSLP
jgi:hypothetical protein